MDDYVIFKFYHIQHVLFSDAEISLNDITYFALSTRLSLRPEQFDPELTPRVSSQAALSPEDLD